MPNVCNNLGKIICLQHKRILIGSLLFLSNNII